MSSLYVYGNMVSSKYVGLNTFRMQGHLSLILPIGWGCAGKLIIQLCEGDHKHRRIQDSVKHLRKGC